MSILHTSTYAATGSGTVHTCAISPTPTAGRKLVAVAAKGSTESSHSAGWTKVSSASDLNAVELDTYERWADGTEVQFQVNLSAAATACIAVFENSGLQNASADVGAAYSATVSYATKLLGVTPVGAWHLQDASGTTAVDSAASPHNGSYVGGATLAQAGPLVDRSSSVAFASGYVNIPNTAALEFDTATAITIRFALKASSAPGTFKHIVSMSDNDGKQGYHVSTGSGGGLEFGIGTGSAAPSRAIAYTWDTNWHEYVFQFGLYDENLTATAYSYLAVWVDGALQYNGPLLTTSDSLTITGNGADPLRLMDWAEDTNFSLAFPGSMAYADIYSTGLGATFVTAAYSIFSAGTSTSTPNTGTTGVVASAGDVDFAAFAYQSATDDTVSGYSGSFISACHLISTNGTGTKTHLDVATQTAGSVATQSASITYGTAQARRSASITAFLPSSATGTGALYPKYKQSLLTQSPAAVLTSVKAAAGRIADGFVFDPTHRYFSDISAVMISTYSTAVSISGVTAPNGVAKPGSPHIQFPITSGAPVDFVVYFIDGGSAGASPLVCYAPLAGPVTPVAGQVVQVDFDTGTVLNGLFAI